MKMFNAAKNSRQDNADHLKHDRRNKTDRRESDEKTRFPFIDKNSKLVMKDRRVSERRTSNAKSKRNPLKLVNKLLKR